MIKIWKIHKKKSFFCDFRTIFAIDASSKSKILRCCDRFNRDLLNSHIRFRCCNKQNKSRCDIAWCTNCTIFRRKFASFSTSFAFRLFNCVVCIFSAIFSFVPYACWVVWQQKKNSSNKVSEIQGWNSKFAKCIQSYWDVSKPKADAEEIEKKVTSKKNKIIWTISVKRTNKIITWIFVSCNCGMVQWTCQKKKNERTASIK